MIPKRFDYYAPTTLSQAVHLLGQNEGAKLLAGGQSLLPQMKLRLVSPTVLVDISRIQDLFYVRDQGEYLAIGALTTYDRIEQDETIKERFTAINDAVVRVADQQVRNRGTIGGGACYADPAGDLPTALLVSDARFDVLGRNDHRAVLPARNFFVDSFATALGHDEILVEVRLPYLPPNSASAFIKHSLREADRAIAAVGCALTIEGGNSFRDVRIGIGGAGSTPLRAISAENYLEGRTIEDAAIAEAAEKAVEGADPASDALGSREYRLEIIKVLTRKTLKVALSRASK